jgi:predicted transposase YbfD/YdcC
MANLVEGQSHIAATAAYADNFVSSRKLTANQALIEVRKHWGIENKVHWF